MHAYEKCEVRVVGGSKLLLAVLVVLAATVLAGVGASAVREKAKLELIPTGVITQVEGDADLRLRIDDRVTEFRATAFVEGDGLIEDVFYSMWLADRDGNVLFLDASEAEEECVIDPVKGEEDGEVVVDLHNDREQAPFSITSLERLTINIRDHFFRRGDGSVIPVVLTGTVTTADLD